MSAARELAPPWVDEPLPFDGTVRFGPSTIAPLAGTPPTTTDQPDNKQNTENSE